MIILFFASPFLVSWKIILTGIAVYYLQLLVFGGCLLTKAELDSTEEGFYYHYLKKMGLPVTNKGVNFCVDYITPAFIFTVAIIHQF